jgi:hypothetical protein
VVWCPIPVITHLFPPIGHLGVCYSDGTILDFLGTRFVHRGSLGFGAVAKYWRLDPRLWPSAVDPSGDAMKRVAPSEPSPSANQVDIERERGVVAHDTAVTRAEKFFSNHENYDLLGNNCHQFVAHAMNCGGYDNKTDWNMVHLAVLVVFKGRWVSAHAFAKTWGFFLAFATVTLCVFPTYYAVFVGVIGVFLLLASWFAYYSFVLAQPRRKVFATPVVSADRVLGEGAG